MLNEEYTIRDMLTLIIKRSFITHKLSGHWVNSINIKYKVVKYGTKPQNDLMMFNTAAFIVYRYYFMFTKLLLMYLFLR